MKKINESNYEAPQVEIIEVEIEKGFATSGTGEDVENEGDPLFL